jgi:hypothetical protein
MQELELAPLMNIIVTETQQLLSAERCTVFMVDDERDEMWTTASMSHGMGAPLPVNKNVEVITRFPKNRGIAGHVATTGEILNIPDAYQDSRFNQKFDKETGFRTRAMLCVPILHQQQSQQKIMGVMQVLNKKNQGVFTDEDVRLLQVWIQQFLETSAHFAHRCQDFFIFSFPMVCVLLTGVLCSRRRRDFQLPFAPRDQASAYTRLARTAQLEVHAHFCAQPVRGIANQFGRTAAAASSMWTVQTLIPELICFLYTCFFFFF